jgi:hypothetical protein
VGLTRILLLVGDILSGDRGLRNDEFASWPVQGIWKCVSGAVYTDVDYGDGCTMRSKCCSPVEKNNVPSVMRPWELPFS